MSAYGIVEIIEEGDVEKVKNWLRMHGASINNPITFSNDIRHTVLWLSVRSRNVNIVDEVVKVGGDYMHAEWDEKDNIKKSPLSLAIELKSDDIVNYLLKEEALIDEYTISLLPSASPKVQKMVHEGLQRKKKIYPIPNQHRSTSRRYHSFRVIRQPTSQEDKEAILKEKEQIMEEERKYKEEIQKDKERSLEKKRLQEEAKKRKEDIKNEREKIVQLFITRDEALLKTQNIDPLESTRKKIHQIVNNKDWIQKETSKIIKQLPITPFANSLANLHPKCKSIQPSPNFSSSKILHHILLSSSTQSDHSMGDNASYENGDLKSLKEKLFQLKMSQNSKNNLESKIQDSSIINEEVRSLFRDKSFMSLTNITNNKQQDYKNKQNELHNLIGSQYSEFLTISSLISQELNTLNNQIQNLTEKISYNMNSIQNKNIFIPPPNSISSLSFNEIIYVFDRIWSFIDQNLFFEAAKCFFEYRNSIIEANEKDSKLSVYLDHFNKILEFLFQKLQRYLSQIKLSTSECFDVCQAFLLLKPNISSFEFFSWFIEGRFSYCFYSIESLSNTFKLVENTNINEENITTVLTYACVNLLTSCVNTIIQCNEIFSWNETNDNHTTKLFQLSKQEQILFNEKLELLKERCEIFQRAFNNINSISSLFSLKKAIFEEVIQVDDSIWTQYCQNCLNSTSFSPWMFFINQYFINRCAELIQNEWVSISFTQIIPPSFSTNLYSLNSNFNLSFNSNIIKNQDIKSIVDPFCDKIIFNINKMTSLQNERSEFTPLVHQYTVEFFNSFINYIKKNFFIHNNVEIEDDIDKNKDSQHIHLVLFSSLVLLNVQRIVFEPLSSFLTTNEMASIESRMNQTINEGLDIWIEYIVTVFSLYFLSELNTWTNSAYIISKSVIPRSVSDYIINILCIFLQKISLIDPLNFNKKRAFLSFCNKIVPIIIEKMEKEDIKSIPQNLHWQFTLDMLFLLQYLKCPASMYEKILNYFENFFDSIIWTANIADLNSTISQQLSSHFLLLSIDNYFHSTDSIREIDDKSSNFDFTMIRVQPID